MLILNFDKNNQKVLPLNWGDVSLELFQKIILIQSDKEINDDEKLNKIIETVFNMPIKEINKIDKNQLVIIMTKIAFLVNYDLSKKEKYEDLDDYFLINFDEITLGEWIDLDFYLTKFKNNIFENLDKIVQILYRKEKKYSPKKIKARKNIFIKKMQGIRAMQIFEKFIKFREKVYGNFDSLFGSDETEGAGSGVPQEHWGWLGFAYSLCNDDITKLEGILELSLITTLNFASYRKSMIQNEKNLLKTNR